MRNRVSVYRSRILGQAALAAVLAATAAGCSESSRFGTPLFTGSTENQRQIIGNSQPMPPAATPGAVYSSDLPPPGATAYAASPYATSPYAGSSLPPGDYVWTPDGVQPTAAASMTPSTVSYGQPSYEQPSYAAPQAPTQQAIGGTYVVSSGDTLYSIGRRHGVSANEIAAANGLSSPENIRIGQRLEIPGAGSTSFAAATPKMPAMDVASTAPGEGYLGGPSASSAPRQIATSEPRIIPGVPSIPVENISQPPVQQASANAAVDDIIEPPSANGTTFRWPVRGRIISGYGAKPNGQRNDGINLAVPEGTTVKAAEAGTVIYAGNELEGYGNLVLIRHADDWVSAYAHNSEIKVRRGDTVRRGQTLATAGMSGSVTSPQVHFELRKKAKPVNPLDYLAGV